jgi:hypothetical protein
MVVSQAYIMAWPLQPKSCQAAWYVKQLVAFVTGLACYIFYRSRMGNHLVEGSDIAG